MTNMTTKKTFQAQPAPGKMKEVLARGGILGMLKEIARMGLDNLDA